MVDSETTYTCFGSTSDYRWMKLSKDSHFFFEKAAVNTFTISFLSFGINGCYFHLCQCFSLELENSPWKIIEFAFSLKFMPTLAFIPEKHVEPCFDLVVDEICAALEKLSLDQRVPEEADQLGTS